MATTRRRNLLRRDSFQPRYASLTAHLMALAAAAICSVGDIPVSSSLRRRATIYVYKNRDEVLVTDDVDGLGLDDLSVVIMCSIQA